MIANLIQWSEAYSVGVRELDEEHRIIVNIINALAECKDRNAPIHEIQKLLIELADYATQHFQTEEQLLSKYNYEGQEEQKREHQKYRMKVLEYCTGEISASDQLSTDLLGFLSTWWNTHILRVDMQYRSFLNSNGVN